VKALPHFLMVRRGRKPVAPWAEMLGNGPMRREKALSVAGGLEPLHPSLALARRLVRIFRAVVQIAMLPMFYTG
jgi:hypothetical protein